MAPITRKLRIVLFEWRPVQSLFKWESLGIQYITAILREAGFYVEIFVFEDLPVNRLCERVLSYRPDVVGFPIYQETYDTLAVISGRLKELNPKLRIIVGGHTVSLYASQILVKQPAIDVAVVGEGEATVLEVCECIETQRSLEHCRGIQYYDRGLIYRNQDRAPLEDLDRLPFPALDILERTSAAQESVLISLSTSRGCLGNCSFCVEHRVSKRPGMPGWKGRSCENIIAEIDHLARKFAHKRLIIHFVDGSFEDPDALRKERLRQLVTGLKSRKYLLAFSFLTRSESWTEKDRDLIGDLRSLGLYSVSVGFESGSDSTLKVFNKRAKLEDHKRITALFTQNGVNVAGFMIMYHPYATLESLKESADFLEQLQVAYRPEVWFHELNVYPDTRIFRQIVDDGLLLGADSNGFVYRYAFEDGRVFALYRTMKEIQTLPGIMRFQTSCEKINFEIMLYGVWREKIVHINSAKEIMQEYAGNVQTVFQTVGKYQYEFYNQLLHAAGNHQLDRIKDGIKTRWDQVLTHNQERLEKLWLKNKLNLGRQKIRLI
jgi:anaerobic magnesium-protoporphyrin IX monomethyl ester cyclase